MNMTVRQPIKQAEKALKDAGLSRIREAAVMQLASYSRAQRTKELQSIGYSRASANAAADVLELMIDAFVLRRPAEPLSGKAEESGRA